MDRGDDPVVATQGIVATQWVPRYSRKRNYISDLGNTACGPFAVPHGTSMYVCSPWHAAMNVSFVVAGMLTAAGAVLLRHAWPRRLATVMLVSWVLIGLGKALVGLVPENTEVGLHLLGALNVPVGSAVIMLFSFALRRTNLMVAAAGMVLGAVGLAGSILSTVGQFAGSSAYAGLGAGGMERVSVYPGLVWALMIGVVMCWYALSGRDVDPAFV